MFNIALSFGLFFECKHEKAHDKAPHRVELSEYCKKKDHWAVLLTILLMLASALFGLFTTAMLCEQSMGLQGGNTYIDRLQARYRKGPAPPKPSFWQNLESVFGNKGSRMWWALPVAPEWKDPSRVLGYDLPREETEDNNEEGSVDLEMGGSAVELASTENMLASIDGDKEGAEKGETVPLMGE